MKLGHPLRLEAVFFQALMKNFALSGEKKKNEAHKSSPLFRDI